MKVHFTDAALDHLDAIYAYVAKDSPKYAQQVVDRITEKASQVSLFPEASAVVPEYSRPDVREVFAYQYRIIYLVLPERIDVLAMIHGARQLPPRIEELP